MTLFRPALSAAPMKFVAAVLSCLANSVFLKRDFPQGMYQVECGVNPPQRFIESVAGKHVTLHNFDIRVGGKKSGHLGLIAGENAKLDLLSRKGWNKGLADKA